MDLVDKETRSRTMALVRHKNTKPELALRRALFSKGLRYRLHDAVLPGKPDLIFRKRRVVIFVHGCFWHWHGCRRSRMPTSNVEYWTTKIKRNRDRDKAQVEQLLAEGWRVLIVWECALKKNSTDFTAEKVLEWMLADSRQYLEIGGAI